METDVILERLTQRWTQIGEALAQPGVYVQLGIIVLVVFLAYLLSNRIRHFSPILNKPPTQADKHPLRSLLYRGGNMLFPVFTIMLLRFAMEAGEALFSADWVMVVALAVGVLLVFHQFINLFVTNPFVAATFRWVGLPILVFHFAGVLDNIIRVLESMAVSVGNIRFSAYGLVRVLIFGSLLFWLGRISNVTGQSIIRRQQRLDMRTREMFAKLFEIAIFFLLFLLILQVMGVNLTALAVFGGALGVGLGFGLQSIASNFISGIIILMDRSVSLGDYVELEDGRTGIVTQLSMRSTTLETYDGQDVVVPNEQFITSSFTNWTHKDNKQRYRVDFTVAYKTDIRKLVEVIKAAVATHPQVLSGEQYPIEERPDCEIDSFGDSGVNMFVEFWMRGIDDGKNRVGGDLLLIIYETMLEHGFEIPFPQREVRVLEGRGQPPVQS